MNSHRYDQRHDEKESTALVQQKKQSNRKIDLENISIFAYENNGCKRKLREAVEIIRDERAILLKNKPSSFIHTLMIRHEKFIRSNDKLQEKRKFN